MKEVGAAPQRSHLHALALFAGEWGLNHAIVLPQCPRLVDKLDIVAARGRDSMSSQRVFTRQLWSPLGVINVENNVSFAHVKVPGDHGGRVYDFYQQLV